MYKLYFLFLLPHLVTTEQTCYYPDGTIAPNSTSCNPESAHSACCSIVDYCLTNGFCFDSGGDNLFSRESCTDPCWNSPSCPQYCVSTWTGGPVALASCPYNAKNKLKFCCDDGNVSTCCDVRYSANDNLMASTALPYSAATNTVATTATAPSSVISSSGSSTPFLDPNTSNHRSLAIGLGVGIPLGVALLGILSFFAFELRPHNNIRSVNTGGAQAAASPQAKWETRHELPQENM